MTVWPIVYVIMILMGKKTATMITKPFISV